MIIKAVLLTGLACAALLSLRSESRTAGPTLRRLAVCALLAAGCVSILFPAVVTHVANAVGVGRGADLLLYTLAVASLFGWIGTHKRLQQVEDDLVTLARGIALNSAITGTHENEPEPAVEGKGHRRSLVGGKPDETP